LSLPRRRDSFFLHLRPDLYQPAAVSFRATWYLGFLSVFFLVLELVTGVILMVYYVPTPEGAYGSIIRLQSDVLYGWLMRDLHRLGGECMVVVAVAHLARVFLAGAYVGKRRLTWVTGVLLLLCTLLLAFSGYLLPWDQLAFWAVTIGTGMVETIPGVGHQLTLLLRGGPEFGADGLLRFYLLHIVVLPVAMAGALAVHYYRVSRQRSVMVAGELRRRWNGSAVGGGNGMIPLLPNLALLEALFSILLLCLMIGVVAVWYDAPLQHHADPRHTPAATQAPWFFLWLQGALKLGDGFIMGICLPAALVILLFALPYLGPLTRRLARHLFLSPVIVTMVAVVLVLLSYRGLPGYESAENDVAALLEHFAPEEGESRFHAVAFDRLPQGIYEIQTVDETQVPVELSRLLLEVRTAIARMAADPHHTTMQGVVIMEDWQTDLKRITVRLHWQDSEANRPVSAERVVFRHNLTGGGNDTPI
jgi:quinol-cytochrome oxidoreductase complex cytochrome b subunit